jgi:hypothetical protein
MHAGICDGDPRVKRLSRAALGQVAREEPARVGPVLQLVDVRASVTVGITGRAGVSGGASRVEAEDGLPFITQAVCVGICHDVWRLSGCDGEPKCQRYEECRQPTIVHAYTRDLPTLTREWDNGEGGILVEALR